MLDPNTIAIDEQAQPASGLATIALDRLMLSKLNVRQTERDADIASLADDIAARGLKQNLVVVPAHFVSGDPAPEQLDGEPLASGGKNVWQGRFEVIAGGRRLQAMQLLAGDGRLPADHPVPCLVEERDQARETSLSENLHKVTMNPADEFEAYQHIVDHARDTLHEVDPVAYCAKRFGKTLTHVKGRLRLATLAREILQALREDKIGLDAAKAYGRVEDHELQLKVFKENEKPNSWKPHDPTRIREALSSKSCSVTDPRAIFVGIEAFVEAGGRVETEMFMGAEAGERITNLSLLDKLARAKAEGLVPALAKEHGFKSGVFATRGTYDVNFPKTPEGFVKPYEWKPKLEDLPKAQRKKCIAIYCISADGSELHYAGRFAPGEERKASPGYTPPTPEQIAAQRRAEAINVLAARLAVGKFAGTPLEGRGFWPNYDWIPRVKADEDEILVAVLIKVSPEDVLAHREAAGAQYDAELAAREEEKARKTAEAAAEAADEGDVAGAIDALDDEDEEEDEELAS